jgi:putative metallohydrolase (TIGR04338 family)
VTDRRAPSPSSRRDSQRGKVYEAQHLVQRLFDRSSDFPMVQIAGSELTLPVERRFADLESVQRYVDSVLALGWVRRGWARAAVPVTVRARRGQQQAHYERDGAVMAVPLHAAGAAWALRELVVLHELAHHLDDEDMPAHGPSFVARYLRLLGEIVGDEAALLLRISLFDLGVRIG